MLWAQPHQGGHKDRINTHTQNHYNSSLLWCRNLSKFVLHKWILKKKLALSDTAALSFGRRNFLTLHNLHIVLNITLCALLKEKHRVQKWQEIKCEKTTFSRCGFCPVHTVHLFTTMLDCRIQMFLMTSDMRLAVHSLNRHPVSYTVHLVDYFEVFRWTLTALEVSLCKHQAVSAGWENKCALIMQI